MNLEIMTTNEIGYPLSIFTHDRSLLDVAVALHVEGAEGLIERGLLFVYNSTINSSSSSSNNNNNNSNDNNNSSR